MLVPPNDTSTFRVLSNCFCQSCGFFFLFHALLASKTLTIKRPIPGPLTRNRKTMDLSRTKPMSHVTWHYVGILSEFMAADRSLSSSKGGKVMKRQVSVSISVSSPTSNNGFISNPDSSAHNS